MTQMRRKLDRSVCNVLSNSFVLLCKLHRKLDWALLGNDDCQSYIARGVEVQGCVRIQRNAVSMWSSVLLKVHVAISTLCGIAWGYGIVQSLCHACRAIIIMPRP
jgi:hypothetical protein